MIEELNIIEIISEEITEKLNELQNAHKDLFRKYTAQQEYLVKCQEMLIATSGIMPTLKSLKAEGRPIDAIKLLRQTAPMSLRQAKNYIDGLKEN